MIIFLIILATFAITTVIFAFVMVYVTKAIMSPEYQLQNQKYVLVIAHPDDESMFFVCQRFY